MKYLLLILMIFGFLSCSQVDNLDKYKQALPDSILINDVISSVIKLDSLNYNANILKTIQKIYVYKPEKWDNDSIPPPPPPPMEISYDLLFSKFEATNDKNKRFNDSIFISLQADTARNFIINRKTYSLFNHQSHGYFIFYLPLFSFDKQFAFIQYWRHCGPLCGSCQIIILKWSGKEWVRINGWCCGIS